MPAETVAIYSKLQDLALSSCSTDSVLDSWKAHKRFDNKTSNTGRRTPRHPGTSQPTTRTNNRAHLLCPPRSQASTGSRKPRHLQVQPQEWEPEVFEFDVTGKHGSVKPVSADYAGAQAVRCEVSKAGKAEKYAPKWLLSAEGC